ncbi:TrkA-C domain-containing protein [Natronoarchaeum philippinense]|uniref:TrkA-C domain-containing protein n=1 Tax=Natronoarchaeum philippinense TaxID=558529 RepID=A0A285P7X0_NATPI|nr:TrkA C-terminal domain-containing protein [Natronoarchaeum philippinense]SNZ17303.1 TrkA-C domain-containing protein [Natronoarchaeum philippinense]
MASLPVELLFGLYVGLLTGIVPALISGSLGFLFRYVTGVSVPALAVVVLAVAVAGINGGLLGLVDPAISQSPRLLVAALVVMMLSLYAHSQGDALGATFPRRFSIATLRKQTLSADVVDFVGAVGQVTIRPTGEVGDVDGYPPLSADLREELRGGSWRFPADLPLAELESRLARRLRTEFDLAAVDVSIDERGRATIDAAPPSGGLSRRISPGQRAVSVSTLVPTGVTRGERVAVVPGTDADPIEGTVVSARSGADSGAGGDATDPAALTDGGESPLASTRPSAPTTTGGDGRVTVSVPTADAEQLLAVDRGQLRVQPRDAPAEFELLSVLRRTGKFVESLAVRAGGPLDGAALDPAAIREDHGVTVLGIRRSSADADGGRWTFSLDSSPELAPEDAVFVAGPPDAVARAREVLS